jgi:predicted ester cyclase
MGSIPPTGKSLTLNLCDVYDIEDGKVKFQRTYLDTGSMMAQLGLFPEQTAAATQQ